MKNKSLSHKIRTIAYTLLSFLLALLLSLLSVCVIFEITLFNSNFIFDNMNSSNYFIDKKDEITDSLTDLGYASGIDESFFGGLLDEVMLSDDTYEYLNSYYAGNGTKINTTNFKQSFDNAINNYIQQNNLQNINDSSRENLLNKATTVYKRSLEIPFFSKLSAYFLSLKNAMPIIIGALIVLSVVICVVLILTNEWKHRGIKYIYYAFAAAFLAIGVIPAYLLISNKISHINLASRALYNLFVQCANSICITALFCSLFFLVSAIALYFQYRKMHKMVSD